MTEHLSRDTRREQILNAAAKLFVTQGYDNASVDEVAREAGLSKGSIYWYFKSKLEILFELTDRYVEGQQSLLVRMASLEAFGPEALYRSHRTLDLDNTEERENAQLFNQLVALAGQHAEICERLARYQRRWTETAAELIQRAIDAGFFRPVDPMIVAHAITSLYLGLYSQKQIDPSIDVITVIETATKLMYEALTISPSVQAFHATAASEEVQ
jgi:AcrR family transcriptional regulator